MRLVAFAVALFLPAVAHAQTNPCPNPGTYPACPFWTAPAVTSAPGPALDGSVTVQPNVSTILFGGRIPPNGFMVSAGGYCVVNDHGPASMTSGFSFGGPNPEPWLFITPTGYRPMGVVSVSCLYGGYIAARAW
jgi:hypothetical protein